VQADHCECHYANKLFHKLSAVIDNLLIFRSGMKIAKPLYKNATTHSHTHPRHAHIFSGLELLHIDGHVTSFIRSKLNMALAVLHF
jgi:hypothetical protein